MPELSDRLDRMIFWLVRHGQTDWNLEGRYQGQADPALNQAGLEEARLAGRRLKPVPLAAIYTSDLLRARQTAEILSVETSAPVYLERRLREIRLGEWEGQIFSLIQARYPQEIERREKDPFHFRPPGGENLQEVWQRVRQAIDEIARRHPNDQVVVVSHGLALAALIAFARENDPSLAYQYIPANADPFRLEWPVDHRG